MENIPGGGSNQSEMRRLQLKLAGRAVTAQKRAVWDVTKQYTWWLLTIAIALMVLATRVELTFRVRATTILVGLVVEFVLSSIAFGVLRRECSGLGEQLRLRDRLAKELALEEPALAGQEETNKGVASLIGGLVMSAKMRTWDWFQATFMLTAALSLAGFIVLLVYAILK